MCVCPKTINNLWRDFDFASLIHWLNNFCCFSVSFMALIIDAINRRGPSNKMCHQLQPKKTNVKLYNIYNSKMEHFSFKSGCVAVRVENGKMRRQLQPTFGCTSRLYNNKTHSLLLTRRSTKVFKMGMSYGWLSV